MRRVEWLYGAPGDPESSSRFTPTDDDPRSHGSCVASKAVGRVSGVSKFTHVINVKSNVYHSDLVWAFLEVKNSMLQHRGRKSVIVFATGSTDMYGPTTSIPRPWRNIRGYMKDIIAMDGVIVVGAGNRRDGNYRKNVDVLPALFESLDLPLIVAGSVENSGNTADFSQGPAHVSIWAPGIEVACTRPNINVNYGTGTSYSAGMVSL